MKTAANFLMYGAEEEENICDDVMGGGVISSSPPVSGGLFSRGLSPAFGENGFTLSTSQHTAIIGNQYCGISS